jgi:hypothetical protein
VPEDQELCAQAERFAGLFRAIYLTFHRRDGPRNELSGASRAVLQHLAMSGPLTVGEAAVHLDRAQSVVSEIVDGLTRKDLLERERDPGDRRRTLVWLTPAGQWGAAPGRRGDRSRRPGRRAGPDGARRPGRPAHRRRRADRGRHREKGNR